MRGTTTRRRKPNESKPTKTATGRKTNIGEDTAEFLGKHVAPRSIQFANMPHTATGTSVDQNRRKQIHSFLHVRSPRNHTCCERAHIAGSALRGSGSDQ